MAFVARRLGRPLARLLVGFISLYYTLASRRVRAALRSYYDHLGSERLSFLTVYRHVRTFAWVTLDRFLLTPDRAQLFDITRSGNELLGAHREAKTGAILVGAHIGLSCCIRGSRQAA